MFIYNLFGLPVESAFGDSIGSYTLLNRYKFNPWIMAAEILIGLFMAAILLYYGYRKKRMLLLTVPAVIFSLFCAFVYIYMMTKRHNNANIIAMGSRVVGTEMAKMIVDAFFDAEFEGGRHQRRIDMITQIEKDYQGK